MPQTRALLFEPHATHDLRSSVAAVEQVEDDETPLNLPP